MAMSANSDWLDQFEEGNAAGGHAGEVEAIPYPAVSAPMTSPPLPASLARRQDARWLCRTGRQQAIAYLYSRDSEADARQAKVLTNDEARRIASIRGYLSG
jgi:hypothetical protein